MSKTSKRNRRDTNTDRSATTDIVSQLECAIRYPQATVIGALAMGMKTQPIIFDFEGQALTAEGWREGLTYLLLKGLTMEYHERDLSRQIMYQIPRTYEGGGL